MDMLPLPTAIEMLRGHLLQTHCQAHIRYAKDSPYNFFDTDKLPRQDEPLSMQDTWHTQTFGCQDLLIYLLFSFVLLYY